MNLLEKLKKLGYKIDWDKLVSKKWVWKKFKFVKAYQNHPHRKVASKDNIDIVIESISNSDFLCWIDIKTDNEDFVYAIADLVEKYKKVKK